MRSYNDLAKGLRALRKLIEAEVKLSVSRRKLIKRVKSEADEAEDLFNE
jgi:ribosomal protein L10